MLARFSWEVLPSPEALVHRGQRTISAGLAPETLRRMVRQRLGRTASPWQVLLGTELQRELYRWAIQHAEPSPELAHALVQSIGTALREALGRPMLYRDRPLRARRRWLLVSRSGLLILASHEPHGLELLDIQRPLAQPLAEGWQEVAKRLIMSKMRWLDGAISANALDVEFVTAEAWGLVLSGDSLVWTGKFPPWHGATGC